MSAYDGDIGRRSRAVVGFERSRFSSTRLVWHYGREKGSARQKRVRGRGGEGLAGTENGRSLKTSMANFSVLLLPGLSDK